TNAEGGDGQQYRDDGLGIAVGNERPDLPSVDENDQDESQKYQVFAERLPGRQRDGIAKASAGGDDLEEGGVKRQKRKKEDEEQQAPRDGIAPQSEQEQGA